MTAGLKVGDLYAVLGLEKKAFELDLQKAGIIAGAALGAMGVAALRMGDDYDAAADGIRTATGKTGEDLRGLEQSWHNVAGRVKEDIGLVAQVMGDLAARTGLVGGPLEDLTQKVIEFSRVTGTDAVANTALVTRVFGDWSVATEDQAETMDQLLRASQATGLGVDALMQTVVQFGAPLRLLGFGFEESIALLGKWEKEGVNTDTMLQGLKFSVKTLAQEGVPASEMAETLRAKIAAIGTSTDPVSESIKLFGLRAGPDLAAAILEGRFSVDDLIDTIENGSETISQAVDDTRDFGDGIAELKNKIKTAIGPIIDDFAGLSSELGNAIYLLPALGGAIGGVTAKLWAKVLALKAAEGGWVGMLRAAAPAAAAFAIIGAELLVLDRVSGDLAQTYVTAADKIRGLTSATTDQIAELRTGAQVARERADGLKIMGVWDTQASIALRDMGIAADEAADRLERARTAAIPDPAAAPAMAQYAETLRGVAGATGEMETAVEHATMGVDDDLGLMELSFGRMRGSVVETLQETAAEFHARMVQMHLDGAWAGAQTPGAFSEGLRSHFDTVQSAFKDLKDLIKNTLSPAAQEAELIGIATSKRLAKALNDGRPEVRAAGQQVALDTLAQLQRLSPGSEAVGKLSMQLLASATEAEKPAIRDAIAAIVGTASTGLDRLPTIASNAGTDTGQALAAGLNSASVRRAVRIATSDIAGIIQRGFLLESPAKEGPWSEKGGPFAWMERAGVGMGDMLAGGLRARVPVVLAARSALASAFRPAGVGELVANAGPNVVTLEAASARLGAPARSVGDGGPGSGTVENHWHIGVLVADDQGVWELEQRMSRVSSLRTRSMPVRAG